MTPNYRGLGLEAGHPSSGAGAGPVSGDLALHVRPDHHLHQLVGHGAWHPAVRHQNGQSAAKCSDRSGKQPLARGQLAMEKREVAVA